MDQLYSHHIITDEIIRSDNITLGRNAQTNSWLNIQYVRILVFGIIVINIHQTTVSGMSNPSIV